MRGNDLSKWDLAAINEYEQQAVVEGDTSLSMDYLKEFWGFVRPHARELLIGGILLLFTTGATLAVPRLIGYVVDDALILRNRTALWWYSGVLVVMEVIRFFAGVGHQYILASLGQKVMQDIRVSLLTHFCRLPMHRLDRIPGGQLLTRVTNDVAALEEMLTSGFLQIVDQIAIVFAVMIAMCFLNFKLAAVSIGFYPLFFVGAYLISISLHQAFRRVRQLLAALNSALTEHLSGLAVVHLFGKNMQQLRRLDRINDDYAEAQLSVIKLRAIFHPVMTLFSGLSMFLLLRVGSPMTASGEIEVGIIVTFFGYLIWIQWPLIQIVERWSTVLAGFAALERIFSALHWDVESGDVPVTNTKVKGEIAFEGVWFAYRGEAWVLQDVSFTICPGERVGFAGLTGSGKSSIVKLLLRFYEPQRGRILLDGRDIQTISKAELRSQIALVQQELALFSGTIRENISLWDEQSGVDAATERHLLGKLTLEARVEEGGKNLSLGERQLITFARAAASNPALWILDEATAHLDPEIERDVTKFLNEECAGSTTIIIAHRLSTLIDADKILVVNRGEIIEQGTHETLIKQDGFYARLARLEERFESEDNLRTE